MSIANRWRATEPATRVSPQRRMDAIAVVQFLLFVLQLVQPVINAALRQQFLVRALFAQAAFVEHQDAVGVLNGAEAVRDDQRGAAGEQAVQRFANQQFRFCVHAGRGFVQNQEARIVRQRPRETDQLPLAHRKRGTALVHFRGHALRQRPDDSRPGRLRPRRAPRLAV